MKKMWSTVKHNPIISTLIGFLIALILFLQLFPNFDIPLWEIAWFRGYIGVTQYYVGLFCSILAFIVGFSINGIFNNKQTERSILLSTGFFILSGFLFINSLTTPDLIFSEDTARFSAGSLQLGLLLSGFCFVLSGITLPNRWQKKLIQFRFLLWVILLLFVVLYFSFGFFNITQSAPESVLLIQNLLIIFLLGGASWQSYKIYINSQLDFDCKMAQTFFLFTFAEIAILTGSSWFFSWALHLPALLLGFILAITAVLGLLKSSSKVPLVRYFVILGITLIVAFSFANVELGMQWIPVPVNRIWLLPLMLMQGFLSFVVLLFIVIYLNRLIKHHTDALKREQHQRAELTQLIVHDLKSPLTVILSGMKLLAHEKLGELNPTQRKLLSSLDQSGYDILSMINDLLDVEKLEEGQLQLVRSLFDPTKLVQDRVEELQIVAKTHQQTLSFTHSTQRPLMRADKRLIQRVINNLVSNALKFTPNDGTIAISIENKKESIVINIADSGPGIPQNERQRIFEKFAQLKGSERRGAGLGLTFCKMVTEAHKGQLTIEDSPLGGALFKLALPIWEESLSEDLSLAPIDDYSLAKVRHS